MKPKPETGERPKSKTKQGNPCSESFKNLEAPRTSRGRDVGRAEKIKSLVLGIRSTEPLLLSSLMHSME